MKNLLDLRGKIDKIDYEILVLLRKRFETAKQINSHKKINGLGVIDKKREKEVLIKIKEESKKLGINTGFARKLFEQAIKQSRKVQR